MKRDRIDWSYLARKGVRGDRMELSCAPADHGDNAAEGDEEDELFDAEEHVFHDLERQVLLEGQPWEDADAEMLVLGMRADEESIDAALCMLLEEEESAVAISMDGVLDAEACARLRAYADLHAVSCGTVDVMDGEGEYQVLLKREELEEMIGKEATSSLWSLPQALEQVRRDGQPTLAPMWLATVSLRKYSPSTRTHLGFHIDSDHCTANVCLSAPAAYTGGHLLLATGGSVREYAREEGDVTIHVGDVAHAVTAVGSGTRYSLLLFYNRPGFLFQRWHGKIRRPSSAPSS